MAMKVPLSFKQTEKVMYDYLMKQLSPSIYVKGLIKAEMGKEAVKDLPRTEQSKASYIDF
jgi:hypothetical protein